MLCYLMLLVLFHWFVYLLQRVIALRITTALVRYTNLLNADRKYLEAGKMLRVGQSINVPFLYPFPPLCSPPLSFHSCTLFLVG